MESVMIKIDKKHFRCPCGCNVFHHVFVVHDDYVFGCNACEQQFQIRNPDSQFSEAV